MEKTSIRVSTESRKHGENHCCPLSACMVYNNRTARTSAREKGAALLMALGLLTVLLLMGLAFSFASTMRRRSAEVRSDAVVGQLLAESGINRTMATLNANFSGTLFPEEGFYTADPNSAWHGRQYLPSINGSMTTGIEQALSVSVSGRTFTPETTLDDDVGWIPIMAKRKLGEEHRNVLIGRMAYLVINESGKIDPGTAVSTDRKSVV